MAGALHPVQESSSAMPLFKKMSGRGRVVALYKKKRKEKIVPVRLGRECEIKGRTEVRKVLQGQSESLMSGVVKL